MVAYTGVRDTHPTTAPVAAGDRIAVIDVLRGFALFGPSECGAQPAAS